MRIADRKKMALLFGIICPVTMWFAPIKWNQYLIYANVCMPAVLDGDVLEWVDLDLDLRVQLNGIIELLDE
jgi:protein associated with RNAse G/E